MDKNIDPSIAESELFQVSLDRDGKDTSSLVHHQIDTNSAVQDDNTSIRNVFRLNEYVADATQHGHNGSTAAAALNMIQYDGFEHGTTESHVTTGDDHLTGAAHYTDFSNNALLNDGFLLEEKPASAVKLVQYKPNEKTKRLGRPRKHISKNLASPEDSSSQNFNEAILSKFRLDTLPLEGPGSRGGRQGGRKHPRGRVSSTSLRKRKSQSLLNFNVEKDGSTLALKLNTELSNCDQTIKKTETIEEYENNLETHENKNDTNINENQENISNNDRSLDIIELSSDSESSISEKPKTKKKSNERIIKSKKSKLINMTSSTPSLKTHKKKKPSNITSKVTSTSRTTVLNNRHKVTRQLPGPIIPLYYDLYDDNVLEAKQNSDATSEKIALGYPISPSPYAKDIIYLISYISKFQSILDIELIGPQDIENGLCLPNHVGTSSTKFILRIKEQNTFNDTNEIPSVMNELFLKLLGLILNRKRDITSQENAISELKTRAAYLGLPKEWRSKGDFKNKESVQSEESDTETKDRSFNPFYFPPFESDGLKGLEPVDRLIMLRVLMQWSLNTSEKIRDFLNLSIQNQDILGDKDTFYVPRSVAKGFKNCEDARKEAENKIKNRKGDLNDLKYVDPVSDPFKHSMRLRLDELFAGDCGFNIGRFYFCRMSSGNSGGLSTVKKMRSMVSETFTLPYSSSFKLYVQDVHQMLQDSLSNYGIEFHNEKEVKRVTITNNYYYEVASNPDELKEFVEYLSLRLGITINDDPINVIPNTSMIYKPVTNLFNYLSWLLEIVTKQFSIQSNDIGSRSLRRKNVDYNQSNINKELGKLIDDNNMEEEEHIDYEKFDDDDYYEDEEDEEDVDVDDNDDYIE